MYFCNVTMVLAVIKRTVLCSAAYSVVGLMLIHSSLHFSLIEPIFMGTT